MISELKRRSADMTMALIDCLVDTLQREAITFCHWKSNFHLKEALAKGGDLDLLVARKDAERFEGVLAALGFKRAVDSVQGSIPSVLHFYGLDHGSGEWVHLHVYYRVVTGESLLKNYHFPVEELLLQNPGQVGGMPVPHQPSELMLFVIRTMLKHASFLEYLLLRRLDGAGYTAVRGELESLLADDSAARCSELLAQWLPSVERDLFHECIHALQTDASFLRRFWLATRLRRQLKTYNRYSFVSATLLRATLFLKLTLRRLQGGKKPKQPASGGALIAFVGPEATGKSTLVKETADWLGQVFDVRSAHLGKPPSTWLTFLPNLTVPLVRRLAPRHRTSRVENDLDDRKTRSVSLLYGLRSVLVAWDRRALAMKLRRTATHGGIVICDRYPSATIGAMDSARLQVPADRSVRGRLLGSWARLENRLYRQIPPPDVVIRVTVPVDVAIERNRERQKNGKENDAYVLRRHMTSLVPEFLTARTFDLDSNQPIAQTVSSVRQIVWDVL
ncbi:MAG TPA: hypothetical protein VIK33_09080 [Anaerolineae bacterium]